MSLHPVIALAALALGLNALAAEPTPGATASPQPRVRLQQTTTGTTVQVAPAAAPAAAAAQGVTMMDRMVVTSSPLRDIPAPIAPRDGAKFSPLTGGTLLERKVGGVIVEAGVWPWFDVFWRDSHFKSGRPQNLRLNVEFLRARW